ncbi:unnamed protein product [Gordionus sp. m RMFG-2023]|uniref:uncharacterized protein LOC135929881 n=1 Tax=Gordionus sp. m RMFG-2023 TaxID=3053472 RepID=UPI0030E5CAEB
MILYKAISKPITLSLVITLILISLSHHNPITSNSTSSSGHANDFINIPQTYQNDDVYYFLDGENLTLRCLLERKNYHKILNKYDLATLYKSFFWSINHYQYTASDLKQDFSHINVDFDSNFSKAKEAFKHLNQSSANHIYDTIFRLFDLKITNISAFDEGYYFCGLRRNNKIKSNGYFSNVTQLIQLIPYGKPFIKIFDNDSNLSDGAKLNLIYKGSNNESSHNYALESDYNNLKQTKNRISLTCSAAEGNPKGQILWITESGLESHIRQYTEVKNLNGKAISMTRIELLNLRPTHHGKKIWCQVYQKVLGRKMTESSTYVTLNIQYKPIIEYRNDEINSEKIIYLREGGNLKKICEAHANPSPNFMWWLSNKHGNFVVAETAMLFISNITQEFLNRANRFRNLNSIEEDLTSMEPYIYCEAYNYLGRNTSLHTKIRFDSNALYYRTWNKNMSRKILLISMLSVLFILMMFFMAWCALGKNKDIFMGKFMDKKLAIIAKNDEKYRVYNPHKPSLNKSNANDSTNVSVISTVSERDKIINEDISRKKMNGKLPKNGETFKYEHANLNDDNQYTKIYNGKDIRVDYDELKEQKNISVDSQHNSSYSGEESVQSSPMVPLASVESESYLDLSIDDSDYLSKATPTPV